MKTQKMIKINWKINTTIVTLLLILALVITIAAEKTIAQQVTCPMPKSFPAKGTGIGISPITAHNPLLGPIPQVVNTPEAAEQQARTDATSQCSSSLGTSIAEAAKACVKYCMAVPKCTAQTSINGPNTCNPDDATCQQKTVLAQNLPAQILNFLQQLIPIPNSQLMSSTVLISECNAKESSSISCECAPQ
jgi:hypothetical protein